MAKKDAGSTATVAKPTKKKKEPNFTELEATLIAKYGIGSGYTTKDGENAESDIVKGSLRIDETAKKRMVTITCRDNGETRDVYTSDLWQVRGLSREGLRVAAGARRKAAKAVNKVTVVAGSKADATVTANADAVA